MERVILKALRVLGLILVLGATADSVLAQPALMPDRPIMNLDEVGIYSVGYAYRGQAERQFPLGWSGFFEEETGVACELYGIQNGQSAFLLHCPWRGGTGIAFQQFAFTLPAEATKITLRGATAMRTENLANSDGVTFRLTVDGVRIFSYHQTNDAWKQFEYDLTGRRGTNIVVRFEVDPGPNNNASFDYSFWSGRELVIEGYTPPTTVHVTPPPLVLSNIWPRQTRTVVPNSGFAGINTTAFSNDVVHFRYAGTDGVLEYAWQRPQSSADGLFGNISLSATLAGQSPVMVPLATAAGIAWSKAATAIDNGWIQTNGGWTLWRAYRFGSTTGYVHIAGELVDKTLSFSVTCDQPFATRLDAGAWGPVLRRRQVAVPYYSGTVVYLPREDLFVGAFLDWTTSRASSYSGERAEYRALTDGSRNCLRERVLFTAACHLAEVFPNAPNPPSPWRDFLANKIVLDIWGGTFSNIAGNLSTLAGYGISNCVAIIHDWQRSGYDNALPMHYPANAAYGGDVGMSNLVATSKRVGIRAALHENYVDYYPNYDLFTTNEIALDSAGELQKAWYNPGTGIQSFAVKPTAILPLASTQSPEIHRRYSTEANYLDVHSAVPPWFHVDQRAGEPGAGEFSQVWTSHAQVFAYERTTHGGPVFGEGNNHWYWSGLLDGAEAQFGSGWPGNGGFTVPLAVDFDLLKIHPLQVNHGMGYYNRWWPSESFQTNWAGPVPLVVLDRYRMQEVIFGHAGFLDGSVYANVPIAWLEHYLVSPVASRYGTVRPVEIQYEVGGAWLDATAAAKSEDPAAFHHTRVRYENGLAIAANGSSNVWTVGEWVLPEFGWIAQNGAFKAGTVLRDGVVTDFADTGDSLFVNARAAVDWNLSAYRRIRPTVATFSQTGNRSFRVTYNWQVQDRLKQDYRCFVHFDSGASIKAQQDHLLSTPTSQWQPGQEVKDGPWTISLPTSLADGTYDWLIGLFDPTGDGGRVRLQGMDDGTSRIRLGKLQVSGGGSALSFVPETNSPAFDPTAWYGRHVNNSNLVVDFGSAKTDGSIFVQRNGNSWSLRTWPRERDFTLVLRSNRFAMPAKIHCEGGASLEVSPVQKGQSWELPLNGAREYHWTNPPPRLAISRSNEEVVLSWPAATQGYTLESTSNLVPPVAWESVDVPVVVTNGSSQITLRAADPRRFHRLKQTP